MRLMIVVGLLLVPVAAGSPAGEAQDAADRAIQAAQEAAADPFGTVEDPEGAVDRALDGEAAAEPTPPEREPGFADRVRDALGSRMVVASIAGLSAAALGIVGFAAVTRYISPKEALRNPQRAMLYGFVRATPGAHLKQLSDEFQMKTSSILWHIRKLEAADLVRSERANGYRVFYPVEGGVEIKRVSRGLTALQNANARAVFETIDRRPGATTRQLAERLSIHAGTIRWHLRKMRDFGLVEELVRDDGSRFYPTPLGKRSLETIAGRSVDAPTGAPAPE